MCRGEAPNVRYGSQRMVVRLNPTARFCWTALADSLWLIDYQASNWQGLVSQAGATADVPRVKRSTLFPGISDSHARLRLFSNKSKTDKSMLTYHHPAFPWKGDTPDYTTFNWNSLPQWPRNTPSSPDLSTTLKTTSQFPNVPLYFAIMFYLVGARQGSNMPSPVSQVPRA